MATTSPIRVDDELYTSAALIGPVMSRSASQQITHWARIGRELETAGISSAEIADVLAGARSYDELDDRAQAIVRAEWSERIDARLDELDLGAEFAAAGVGYAEADADGNVVVHTPQPS